MCGPVIAIMCYDGLRKWKAPVERVESNWPSGDGQEAWGAAWLRNRRASPVTHAVDPSRSTPNSQPFLLGPTASRSQPVIRFREFKFHCGVVLEGRL